MVLILRFIKSLYPLLKDIFLEKKTLGEAFKDSKFKLLILFGVIFSITLNFFLVPKVLSLSTKIIELNEIVQNMQLVIDNYPSDNDYNRERYDSLNYYINELENLMGE